MKSFPKYEAIFTLREILKDNSLQIIHPGKVWLAQFEWFPPISQIEIQNCEAILGIQLPNDYAYFLSNISNGAILYHDKLYGQWGYKIYDIETLMKKQKEWKYLFEGIWDIKLLAIGETYGDRNPIVIDPDRAISEINSYSIREGSEFDKIKDWPIMSKSFERWLDHLITAQGAKFWLWQ